MGDFLALAIGSILARLALGPGLALVARSTLCFGHGYRMMAAARIVAIVAKK